MRYAARRVGFDDGEDDNASEVPVVWVELLVNRRRKEEPRLAVEIEEVEKCP